MGYQEEGIGGAASAAVWDLSVNAAVARFAYSTSAVKAGVRDPKHMIPGVTGGAKLHYSGFGMAGRYVGGGLGASVGGMIGGAALGGGVMAGMRYGGAALAARRTGGAGMTAATQLARRDALSVARGAVITANRGLGRIQSTLKNWR